MGEGNPRLESSDWVHSYYSHHAKILLHFYTKEVFCQSDCGSWMNIRRFRSMKRISSRLRSVASLLRNME